MMILRAFTLLCLSVAMVSPSDCPPSLKQASELVGAGMYNQALTVLDLVEGSGDASGQDVRGLKVYCLASLRSEGYEQALEEFFRDCPASPMTTRLHCRYALNLFDDKDWERALEQLEMVPRRTVSKSGLNEYDFKRGYCLMNTGDTEGARKCLRRVIASGQGIYLGPSCYAMGYMAYKAADYKDSEQWFLKAAGDSRFATLAELYVLDGRFMQKDFDYVITHAPSDVSSVPEVYRKRYARILSETYLIQGDAHRSKIVYDSNGLSLDLTEDPDIFFAASLDYALKDWDAAAAKFSLMKNFSDSTGQVASYKLAYCHVNLKNKVAAMDCFRNAASLPFNAQIRKDAFSNYATLCFDLNGDSKPLVEYMKAYPDCDRDKIYGYIAVAGLRARDYRAALEAFDKIEDLSPQMKVNFMKANYLRAMELIESKAWSDAVIPLKTARFYSASDRNMSRLCQFWLAECDYRTGNYSSAFNVFRELYNTSALDGFPEGEMIPLSMGYCCIKNEDYARGVKWLDEYLNSSSKAFRKEAASAKADALFLSGNYSSAAAAYGVVVDEFYDINDIYPYYQQGMCFSLVGDLNAKVDALDRIWRANPSQRYWADAMYELGRTYAEQKKTDQARRCYNAVARKSSDELFVARSLVALGTLERNAGSVDAAISAYKEVAGGMPQSEYADDALAALESIYQSRNKPQEYLDYLESIGRGEVKTPQQRERMIFTAAEQTFLSGDYSSAKAAMESYLESYPSAMFADRAWYYTAECLKELGSAEESLVWYSKVIDSLDSSMREMALLGYSSLSYSLQHFDDALRSYTILGRDATFVENRFAALVGIMRSSYKARKYDRTVDAATEVISHQDSDASLRSEARYLCGKSLMSLSRRSEGLAMLRQLSSNPSTAYGAEAAYIIIQDCYDRADFASVESLTFEFSEKGAKQQYYLAKAFIVLGDSYVESGELEQAKATFESIRDGYKGGDDIISEVQMRLEKLETMTK